MSHANQKDSVRIYRSDSSLRPAGRCIYVLFADMLGKNTGKPEGTVPTNAPGEAMVYTRKYFTNKVQKGVQSAIRRQETCSFAVQ